MNLIIIYGPPAAGKLTVARELAELTGYNLIDNHFFNNLATIFPFNDPELNQIRAKLNSNFRLELFGEAAAANITLITTMAIRWPDSFDFIRQAAQHVEPRGGHILLIQLHPTLEAMLERVEDQSRQGVKIATKDALLKDLKRVPIQFDKFPDTPHLTVDNTKLSANAVAHEIMAHYKLTEKANP